MTPPSARGFAPPPRPTPPTLWPSLARRSWQGAEALEVMTADVRFDAGGPVVLPGQAALLWELRPDLQEAFPLHSPGSVRAFLTWILGDGCLEGVLEPALFTPEFLAFLDAPPPEQAPFVGVEDAVAPTIGLWLTRGLGHGRGLAPDWALRPDSEEGRMAHALWYAWIAPPLFGWPEGLGGAVRRDLHVRSGLEALGHALSIGAVALAGSREDLRHAFDLQTLEGRSALLRWLVFDGLRELQCGFERFDPELAAWLRAPASEADAVPRWLGMVRDARPDLLQVFPPDQPDTAVGLNAWAQAHFAVEHPGHPLIGLAGLAPSESALPLLRTPILLSGVWSSPSGRGEDLRSTAGALRAVGFQDFLIFDLASRRVLDADGREVAGPVRVEADVNLVHGNADSALIDWRAARAAGIDARRTVGWWAWELETLPSWWRAAFAFCDEVWAGTRFAETAFRHSADRTVRLMPMPVIAEPVPGGAAVRERLGAPERSTLFLLAFDFRSYAARKNPEAAIAAFRQAFPGGDEETVLLIKTQGARRAPAAAAALEVLAGGDPRIRLTDATLDRDELLALTGEIDAFVSLHRSEGFGRGPAEAMALGRPVICTGYSGNADFTRPDTAMLVDYALVPVDPDDYPGVEGQRWAEPDISQAAAHMRRVHTAPGSVAEIAAAGRAFVREAYDAAAAGRRLLAALLPAEPAALEEGSGSLEQGELRQDHGPFPRVQAIAGQDRAAGDGQLDDRARHDRAVVLEGEHLA